MPTVPVPSRPSVSPSTQPLSTSAPPEAFGANVVGAGLQELGQQLGRTSDVFAQRAEQLQAVTNKVDADSAALRVSQRQSEYINKFTTENQGNRAAPALPTAFQELEKIRTEEGAGLRSPNAQIMFNSQTRIGTAQATQNLSSFASRENLDAKNKDIEAGISNTTRGMTIGNFDSVTAPLVSQKVFLQAQLNGWTEEVAKAKIAQDLGKGAYALTVNTAATNPAEAQRFYDAHKELMTPEQRTDVERNIRASAANITTSQVADEAIRAASTLGSNVSTSAPASSYRAAISSIESGGNYAAIGPVTKSGDKAYGKYQVMGKNIPAWTKEVLGTAMTPQQFLASRDAQDAVFDAKFGQSVAKYGNAEDAASVWFTGRPRAQGARSADITGTTGAQYVAKFSKALGTVNAGLSTSDRVDLLETNAEATYNAIALDPRLGGDPQLIAKAQNAFLAKVTQARQLDNLANGAAMERLLTAADQANITDPAQLQQAYPGALNDWTGLSQKAKNSLTASLVKASNTPTNLQSQNEKVLIGLKFSDPTAFSKVKLNDQDITPVVRKALFIEQQKIIYKKAPAEANASLTKVMSSPEVKSQLAEMGIKGTGSADYWHFAGAMQAQYDGFEANHPGKAPTGPEVAKMVAEVSAQQYDLMVKGIPFTNINFGKPFRVPRETEGGGNARAFDVPADRAAYAATFLDALGLPSDSRAVSHYVQSREVIRDQFRAHGHEPTQDEINMIYVKRFGGG